MAVESSEVSSGTFAERLTSTREARGLTIDDLSYKAKVPYSSLRRWEKGGSSPTLTNDLYRLTLALKVSVEYLLFGVEEEQAKEG